MTSPPRWTRKRKEEEGRPRQACFGIDRESAREGERVRGRMNKTQNGQREKEREKRTEHREGELKKG